MKNGLLKTLVVMHVNKWNRICRTEKGRGGGGQRGVESPRETGTFSLKSCQVWHRSPHSPSYLLLPLSLPQCHSPPHHHFFPTFSPSPYSHILSLPIPISSTPSPTSYIILSTPSSIHFNFFPTSSPSPSSLNYRSLTLYCSMFNCSYIWNKKNPGWSWATFPYQYQILSPRLWPARLHRLGGLHLCQSRLYPPDRD